MLGAAIARGGSDLSVVLPRSFAAMCQWLSGEYHDQLWCNSAACTMMRYNVVKGADLAGMSAVPGIIPEEGKSGGLVATSCAPRAWLC